MKKEKSKKILIFFIVYVLCFLYNFFVSTIYNDEIWNFGFSYNIASGLVPYLDFGMLQTPLYFFLASLFIKVFGGYLFSFHLFNCLIVAAIICLIYNKLGLKGLIVIPLVFFNSYPGYNIFSVFLILIILELLEKEFKYKDCVLGFLVGIMFLTKQNIGICLLIPLIFCSKNKLKGLIGVVTPILMFLVYLVWNNAVYEFIDYAILGMFDFGESNKVWLFFPVEVIICLIILFQLVKSKFKNKKLFFLLMYQIVTAPIFDDYHFIIGFIPVLYYALSYIKIEKYKVKYYIAISLFANVAWILMIKGFEGINLYSDKDSYLYGRNFPSYVDLDEITNYVKENSDVYDHIYFFSKNAFYIKLNAKYPLDKFDMICNGNMGYDGSKRYIEEVSDYCNENNCMFILYKYEFDGAVTQTNKDILNYVIDNYELKEEVHWFDIYTNDK